MASRISKARALDLTARGREPEVGITAHDATISFRVPAEGDTSHLQAILAAEPTLALIRERFGNDVVGEEMTMSPRVCLARRWSDPNHTLAVAESCTGGMVASRLTDMAGVSEVFLGGVVTYSNEAKRSC